MIRLNTQHTPITKAQEQLEEMQYALNNLQGNILRGHGRKHSVNLFLRFQEGKAADVRTLIRRLADKGTITSALEQNSQSENRKKDPDSLFCSFLLSAEGYQHLYPLNPDVLKSFSQEFQEGIKGARERGHEPPEAWVQAEEYNFHAMILLAQAKPKMLREAVQNIKEHFAPVIKCPTKDCKEEWGKAMKVNGKVVEHFGFQDNLSQPLFFEKDVRKKTHGGGVQAWDPSAGPNLVLVQDPYGGENACGSYLVFLKLEQNARGFARKVLELATQPELGSTGAEVVRAFIMGRFQDGTPVALQGTAGMRGDLNDFQFSPNDPQGTKCPFQAHIRKVNPRDETAGSRMHQIARRGITYGKRKKEPKDNPSPEEMPEDGVGLLFMCYQRDIKEQFEYLQFLQANNVNFRDTNTGLDPVIGRMEGAPPPQKWPKAWGVSQAEPFSFGGFVTLKGGEYFFAPSLSFLKNPG